MLILDLQNPHLYFPAAVDAAQLLSLVNELVREWTAWLHTAIKMSLRAASKTAKRLAAKVLASLFKSTAAAASAIAKATATLLSLPLMPLCRIISIITRRSPTPPPPNTVRSIVRYQRVLESMDFSSARRSRDPCWLWGDDDDSTALGHADELGELCEELHFSFKTLILYRHVVERVALPPYLMPDVADGLLEEAAGEAVEIGTDEEDGNCGEEIEFMTRSLVLYRRVLEVVDIGQAWPTTLDDGLLEYLGGETMARVDDEAEESEIFFWRYMLFKPVHLPITWSLVRYGDALRIMGLEADAEAEEEIHPWSVVLYRPPVFEEPKVVESPTVEAARDAKEGMDSFLAWAFVFYEAIFQPIVLSIVEVDDEEESIQQLSLIRYRPILDTVVCKDVEVAIPALPLMRYKPSLEIEADGMTIGHFDGVIVAMMVGEMVWEINLVFVILRSVFLPIVWSLVSYGDALALLDLDQPLTIVELVDEEVIRPLSLVFYRPTLTLTVDGDTTMVWMDEDLVQKIDFSFMLYRPIALLADWSLVRYGDILDVMQSSVQARLTKDVDGEKAQEASEKVEDEAIEVVVGSVGGMKVVYKRKKGAVLAIDTCRKPSTPRLAPTSRPSSIPTPDTTPPRPAKEVVYKFQPPLPPPGAKGADPNAPPVKVENKHFVHTPPLPPPPVFNHPPPTKKKNRRQWNPPKKNLVTPTSTPYISKAQPHHHHNYPIGNIQVAPPYIPSHHQQLYYANQHPGYYYPAAPTMNPGQQPSSPPPTMYPGQQPTSPPPTPIRFNPSAMGPWAGNSKWSAPT